jgi:hypothetical protein
MKTTSCKMTLFVTAITVTLLLHVTAWAQADQLPPNFVATAQIRIGDKLLETIAQYYAQRGEFAPFYVETDLSEVKLRPLAWAPNGEWLAIFRAGFDEKQLYKKQLCVLSRTGQLIMCAQESPSSYFDAAYGADQLSTVSWSMDSSKIYFASEAGGTTKLLEVDSLTGATLAELIALAPDDFKNPRFLSWSDNAGFIGLGFGEVLGAATFQPSLLSRNGESLTQLSPRLAKNLSATIESAYLCLKFSPRGEYLVALSPQLTMLYVFNADGAPIYQFDRNSGYGEVNVTCPTWEADESAFVFAAMTEKSGYTLFRVALMQKALSILYSATPRVVDNIPELEYPIDSGFGITASSDKKHYIVLVRNQGEDGEQAGVGVIYPDSHIEVFRGPYESTLYPVWVPPLK